MRLYRCMYMYMFVQTPCPGWTLQFNITQGFSWVILTGIQSCVDLGMPIKCSQCWWCIEFCWSCVHDAVLDVRQCNCRSVCVISACDSSPCQNGGTCTTSSTGGWQCTCPAQIEGATCNGASFCFILAFSVLDCASDSSLISYGELSPWKSRLSFEQTFLLPHVLWFHCSVIQVALRFQFVSHRRVRMAARVA